MHIQEKFDLQVQKDLPTQNLRSSDCIKHNKCLTISIPSSNVFRYSGALRQLLNPSRDHSSFR